MFELAVSTWLVNNNKLHHCEQGFGESRKLSQKLKSSVVSETNFFRNYYKPYLIQVRLFDTCSVIKLLHFSFLTFA